MNKTNPMLLIDYYKAVQAEMLPEKITKSVSYFYAADEQDWAMG